MAADFDPDDKESWYFGQLGRRVTDQLLMNETEGGVFLVRESSSMAGDYVLCVREGNRVAHYIINHTKPAADAPAGSPTMLKIGDKQFASLPELLRFYKLHYLDTTPLIRPAQKILARVKALYNFDGKDPDDLPFRKNEIMYIIARDEEMWWTARNAQGDIGSVPLPYLEVLESATTPEGLLPADLFESDRAASTAQNQQGVITAAPSTAANGNGSLSNNKSSPTSGSGKPTGNGNGNANDAVQPTSNTTRANPANRSPLISRSLPARARAVKRWSKPHDETQLSFDAGAIISVAALHADGTCDGELASGKKGKFPFNCVEWIDSTQTP